MNKPHAHIYTAQLTRQFSTVIMVWTHSTKVKVHP